MSNYPDDVSQEIFDRDHMGFGPDLDEDNDVEVERDDEGCNICGEFPCDCDREFDEHVDTQLNPERKP